jgi:hypothetical protein
VIPYPFTPSGQIGLIEHLCAEGLLNDRRFRAIHPRNTGLCTHLAYIKRQERSGKQFRSSGSSRVVHDALLELLVTRAPLPAPLAVAAKPTRLAPSPRRLSCWR